MDIMKGLGSGSKKGAEGSSDNDFKEYEFQDEQKKRKVTLIKKDLTINKWRSLNSLNPQGMHLNDCLNSHFEKRFRCFGEEVGE